MGQSTYLSLGPSLSISTMGPPRRKLQATAEETVTPPDNLQDGQVIARVVKAEGNNLYTVESPPGKALLVELEARFRSSIWLKRGGFVLVDTTSLADRENKLNGEIINVVRDEKRWRKQPYWPPEYAKKRDSAPGSDDEESRVGKLPPSEDDDAEDGNEDEDA